MKANKPEFTIYTDGVELWSVDHNCPMEWIENCTRPGDCLEAVMFLCEHADVAIESISHDPTYETIEQDYYLSFHGDDEYFDQDDAIRFIVWQACFLVIEGQS